jgi:hypothetical protein
MRKLIVKTLKFSVVSAAGLLATAAVVFSSTVLFAANNEVKVDTAVDANGKLHVPNTYRTTYHLLGTWAAAKDQGAGSEELHVVYASPGSIEAYRKDGHFPDGTVLVKEVYRAATASMTTGTISHAASLRGWFVMVRDGKGRHAESDVWGDGWGWSWFDASDPSTPSRALPTKDGVPMRTFNHRENCLACHSPAKSTELIYIEGYPPLKR